MTELITFGAGLTEEEAQTLIDAAMSGLKRIDSYEATTNASGDAVFTFDPPFERIDLISVQLVTPANSRISWRLTAEDLGGCTIKVEQPSAISVALIGLTVLTSTPVNVASQQIKLLVVGS